MKSYMFDFILLANPNSPFGDLEILRTSVRAVHNNGISRIAKSKSVQENLIFGFWKKIE